MDQEVAALPETAVETPSETPAEASAETPTETSDDTPKKDSGFLPPSPYSQVRAQRAPLNIIATTHNGAW